MNSVYNWFMSQPAEPETESRESSDAVLADKKFLDELKKELKLFEVCLRIYEAECIETI